MTDQRYDRQVRAFGPRLQELLAEEHIGIVGVGGLGSIVGEQLARLGCLRFTLIDDDVVDETSLNRLLGATITDVKRRAPKVRVAERTIKNANHRARARALKASATNPRALRELTECTTIFACTDNHASRLVLDALCCQYQRILVHVGVNISKDDISGECAIPAYGQWCLLCAGIIDPQVAAYETATPDMRAQLKERGYITDVPSPAVYHLNAITASLAVSEFHNHLLQYKPRSEYLVYRSLQNDLQVIKVPPGNDCPHCGERGLRGLGDLAPLPGGTPCSKS